ncbi:MAG: hypothetical protein PVG99_00070 [Desulfobacteraceae bacterium]|jgi:hypothetical protein
MSRPDIYWTGESGRQYGYWIYAIEAQFRKIAGNFIFAKRTETGEWVPIYIGHTRDFDEGMGDQEKEACAKGHGATHAHVHFSSPDEHVRKAEMADLVARWKPVCNS